MTDRELADAAWLELTKTTDSYPAWERKHFPATSHWAHAKTYLDQIGPTPIPPPSIGSYDAAVAWPRDPFTEVRKVPFTDRAGLLNALFGKQPGDRIYYAGSSSVTFDSTDAFRGFYGQNPLGPVVVELGHPNEAHVGFRFTGTIQLPAVFVASTTNLRIYGGETSTPNGGGAGILVMGADTGRTSVTWEDFYSHDCGSDGIDLFPTRPSGGDTSEISDFSFRGIVRRIAQNPSSDPHIDKGTGFHCANTFDVHNATTGKSGILKRGRLAIDGYDSLCGSVIECGSPGGIGEFSGVTYYFRGTRLKLVPTSQTAGNGLQFWGGIPINLDVGWGELIDATGAVIHGYGTKGQGWDSGRIVVEHGRHQNVNQATNADNISVPYDPRFSIVYQDCT